MPISPKKRKNGHPKGIFREIFVSANREMAPFGVVFVHPPENFEQRQLGTIFGIIKICDTSPESSFIANLLASVVKKEYFSKPDRPSFDSFEASLKKANLALAELARQGSVKWIGKICFAGGTIEKNNLHFSKLGTTSILLLRGGALADIGAGLGDETAEVDSHPLKTFSDISSGKVENGDCLIFTTSDLLEIFSLEELRQNAARFPREEFPDILSASLTANSELSGAIVVNMVPEGEVEKKPIHFLSAEKSENRLIGDPPERRRPSVFEQAPAAAGAQYAGNKIARSQDISRFSSLASRSSPSNAKDENKLYVSESEEIIPKKSFGEKILYSAKNIFAAAKNGFLAVWKIFIRIDWRRMFSLIKEIRPLQWRSNLQSWPPENKRKLAIIGAIVVLVIISFSIYKIASRNNSTAQPSQPVAPAEQNVASTPGPSDANAKNIENISQAAALPSDSRELVAMNDSLFALNADKSVLKISPNSGETEKIDSPISSGKFLIATAMPDLNTIFILTADKKVISFTPSNKKFQENAVSLPDSLNAADMKTYLTYIYILDPMANQIYRYPRAEGGFGDRQDWLKAGTDVKNATSFAINEDSFVVSKNQITAYLQGKKDDKLNFENPATPLAIDKIYTVPDLANIYVLDNKNHRVVQFAKDGKIIAQFFNSSIAGIKDFTVDEKNKIIYLQKTDSVLKFSIE